MRALVSRQVGDRGGGAVPGGPNSRQNNRIPRLVEEFQVPTRREPPHARTADDGPTKTWGARAAASRGTAFLEVAWARPPEGPAPTSSQTRHRSNQPS